MNAAHPLATPKKLPRRNFMRAWRNHRGLTLEQLSEASGVAAPTISQIEQSQIGYSWRSLEALAGALNCETGDLLSRSPETTEANSFLTGLKPDEVRKLLDVLKVFSSTEH